jgi:hypothetical protein
MTDRFSTIGIGIIMQATQPSKVDAHRGSSAVYICDANSCKRIMCRLSMPEKIDVQETLRLQHF